MATIDIAQRVGDFHAEQRARAWLGNTLFVLGRPNEAETHLDAGLRAAEQLHDRTYQRVCISFRAIISAVRGDFDKAHELANTGLEIHAQNIPLLDFKAWLTSQRGDFGAVKSYMTEVLKLPADHLEENYYFPRIAYDSGAASYLDIAEQSLADLWDSSRRRPIGFSRHNLGVLAVARKDVAGCRTQYVDLLPNKGRMLNRGEFGTDRLLGLLAQTMGKLDDALTFCRKAGYRPELAWTCCDYADMLTERDDEGDRQKATRLLDESLALSSELGMRPLMERVLSRKMSLQGIDVSSPQTSIDAVVAAVEVERPNLQPHAAPDGTVTVMFTDIEGSTAMTERLGDQKAQDVLRTHNAIIRQQVAAHQGFEVKSQGDGFMLAFASARRALECAIAIQQNFAIHNEEHSDEPIRVRIGLHTGEAIKEGEDFFGKTVILAARIACEAPGGQILVSSLLKALVESSGEFEFGEPQEVELKGLAGSHQMFDVRWRERVADA